MREALILGFLYSDQHRSAQELERLAGDVEKAFHDEKTAAHDDWAERKRTRWVQAHGVSEDGLGSIEVR